MPVTFVNADTLVRTGAAVIYWVTYLNHSAASMAQTIWDNTAASGTKVNASRLLATTMAYCVFEPPIRCGTGIYVQYGGAGGELYVFWAPLT